ncbi:MAG: 50S ribosomal protein L40e [Candidatus Hodarchaeota archaeon]
MPVDDPDKKLIAMRNLIYFKICRKCGVRNALSAKRCRRCRSRNLRFKRREIGK